MVSLFIVRALLQRARPLPDREPCMRAVFDVSESDVAALVARSYLPEEASRDPAAIKAAIEGLMSDVVFDLEAERFTRNHPGNASPPDSVTRDEPRMTANSAKLPKLIRRSVALPAHAFAAPEVAQDL